MKYILVLLTIVLLINVKSFCQDSKKTKDVYDERLSRKDLIIRGDKFYDRLRDFLIKESSMDNDKYIQISFESLNQCDSCTRGIYKFQTLSTNAQLYLYFKYNQDSIKIISNYEIDSLVKNTLSFLNENKFSNQQKYSYIKSIIIFLQEKEEYESYNEFPIDNEKK